MAKISGQETKRNASQELSTGKLIEQINKISAEIRRPISLMEVCGTHTQAVARFGIKQVLPKNIKLVSGPGCPVCVTPQQDIDNVVKLALCGIPIITYGDMLRVPGTRMSLAQAREEGAKVFAVYSVLDALKLNGTDAANDAVFFAVGFETTAPMTAFSLKNGMNIYCAHKTMPQAMKAVAESAANVGGFLNPGHVSAIIGTKPYRIISRPQVISGFEAEDILQSILMLLRMIKNKDCSVKNQYTGVVSEDGNQKAKQAILECFDACDVEWRGLGILKGSGLKIKSRFAKQDAKLIYKDILAKVPKAEEPKGCACGKVLSGLLEPSQCPLFGRKCTPENPVGPCMVSGEGSCSICYKYK
jgi:hydrogenase expression/formation protein HypD